MKTRQLCYHWHAIPLTIGLCSAFGTSSVYGDDFRDATIITEIPEETRREWTPATISSFDQKSLRDLNVNNLYEIGKFVPSMIMENGANTGGAAAPFIRGIGQRNSDYFQHPAIAIVVDGIHYGRQDGALLDLVDVESLEVFRGPQGVLFGRSSAAGAITVNTNKPTDEFSFDLMLRSGNYEQQHWQTTINVPLTDNLFFRLSYLDTERDGYTERNNRSGTNIDETDDVDRNSGNFRARWLASEDLTVDFQTTWMEQEESGRGAGCIKILNVQNQPEPNEVLFNVANVPIAVGLYQSLAPEALSETVNSCNRFRTDKTGKFSTSLPNIYENTAYTASTTLTLNLGQWLFFNDMDAISITGWRQLETWQNADLDGTDVVLFDRNSPYPRESTQLTQELRLNFLAFDQRLQGTIGAFYYDESLDNVRNDLISGPFAVADSRIDSFTNNLFPSDSYDAYLTSNQSQRIDTSTEHFSAFTKLDFELTDQLTVGAGVRFSREKQNLSVDYFALQPIAGSNTLTINDLIPEVSNLTFIQLAEQQFASLATANYPSFAQLTAADILPANSLFFLPEGSTTPINSTLALAQVGAADAYDVEEKFSPYFATSFRLSDTTARRWRLDSALTYLNYNSSYKSGGILSSRFPVNNTPISNTANPNSPFNLFNAEEVSNIELGFKIAAYDYRLIVNSNIYLTEHEHIPVLTPQFDVNNVFIPRFTNDNIASASIKGFETELSFQYDENWLFRFNTSFADGEYDNFSYLVGKNFSTQRIDRTDEDIPYLSEWQVMLAAEYKKKTSWGEFTPQISLSYNSGYSTHYDRLSWQIAEEDILGFIIIGDNIVAGSASDNFRITKPDEWDVSEYLLINTQLRWDAIFGSGASLVAWVKNVADKQFRYGVNATPDINGLGTYAVSPPRTYGVDLIFKF